MAELHAALADMAAASQTYEADCPRLVDEIARIEDRTRPLIAQIREDEQDPERARALTREAHAYDAEDADHANVVSIALAVCWKQHVELRERVQRVVDSMPSL